MGNILIGLAAGTKMGGDSVLFYLPVYLIANVGAFAVVIAFSNMSGSDLAENRSVPFLLFLPRQWAARPQTVVWS